MQTYYAEARLLSNMPQQAYTGKAHQVGVFRGLEKFLKRSSGKESKLHNENVEKRCPFELWAAGTIRYGRLGSVSWSYGNFGVGGRSPAGVVAEGSHDWIWGKGSPREGVCAISVRESKGAMDG